MATNDLGRIQPIPQGDWDALRAYEVLDIVNHNEASWISTGDNLNSPPSETNADWQLLARQPSTATAGTRAVQEIEFMGTVGGTTAAGLPTIYDVHFFGGPTTNFSSSTTLQSERFTIPVRSGFVTPTVDTTAEPPSVTITGFDDEFNGTYNLIEIPITNPNPPERRQYLRGTVRNLGSFAGYSGSAADYYRPTDYFDTNISWVFERESTDPDEHRWLISTSIASNWRNGTVPDDSWVFLNRDGDMFTPTNISTYGFSAPLYDARFAFDAAATNTAHPRGYPYAVTEEIRQRITINRVLPNLAPVSTFQIQDNESTIQEPEAFAYTYVSGNTEVEDRQAILEGILDYANNTLNLNPQWTLTFDATGDSVIDTNQMEADRYSLDYSLATFPQNNGMGYSLVINGSVGAENSADILQYGGSFTASIMQMSNQPIDATFLAHNASGVNNVQSTFTATVRDENTIRFTSTSPGFFAFTDPTWVTGDSQETLHVQLIAELVQQGSSSSTTPTASGVLTIDGTVVNINAGDTAQTVALLSSQAVDNPLWLGSVRGNTKATFAAVNTGSRSALSVDYTGTGLTFTSTFTNGS